MDNFKFPELVETHEQLEKLMQGTQNLPKTKCGTGGARSKLEAVKMCWRNGIDVVVASASEPNVLTRILNGEKVGTYYKAPNG